VLVAGEAFSPCGPLHQLRSRSLEQGEGRVEEQRRRPTLLPIVAESQLSELQNMRVLLEEARVQARSLAYHRRARLETLIGHTLDELERQIEELRAIRG
jgi:hypothetical protein